MVFGVPKNTIPLRVPTAPELEDAGMLSWFKVYEDPGSRGSPWACVSLGKKKGVYV